MEFVRFICASFLFARGFCLVSFDCSGDLEEGFSFIQITEVEREGTVIATFNHTYDSLQWTVSINGTESKYLTQFFTSQLVKRIPDLNSTTMIPGTSSHTQNFVLAKMLDLELLAVDLNSYQPYSSGTGDLTIDLEVLCKNNAAIWKTRTLTLLVQSVNEFMPRFNGAPYVVMLPETEAVGGELINMATVVSDMDAGHTNFKFGIAPYQIVQFDGSRYVRVSSDGHVTLAQPIDYEYLPAGRPYMFVNITVQDDGGLTSATAINVTITDANDQGVQFVYPGCPKPCLNANYTALTNESVVGELEVLPVPMMVADLDTLKDKIVYVLYNVSDAVYGEYFSLDARTGQLYQDKPLVNDTYGSHIYLQVRAEERSNSDHYVETNITVIIQDRLPSPLPDAVHT